MNKHEVIRDMYPSVGTISISAEGVIKARDTNGNFVNLDETKIDAKLEELQVAEPMRLLREERNRRLIETDWRFRTDLSPSQAWKDYCKALRDIPSTATPKTENGRLTNVTWPTKPE
jgi:hypothetical protein|tara:strand:+ start:534 stop:884 length:351 start_codon:yes stop_codon:yes gene_type:complete